MDNRKTRIEKCKIQLNVLVDIQTDINQRIDFLNRVIEALGYDDPQKDAPEKCAKALTIYTLGDPDFWKMVDDAREESTRLKNL